MPPFDPVRVWQWIKSLNFHEGKAKEGSEAIKTLQESNTLRQGIIKHVFGELLDRDEILDARINKFDSHTHAGLIFCTEVHISEHSDQSFRYYPATYFGLIRSLIPRLSGHF
jgi:hypothetical protein